MDTNPTPSQPDPRSVYSQPAQAAASTNPAQVVYVPSAPHPARRWFAWLGWMAFFVALSVILGMTAKYQEYFDTTGGIQEKFFSGAKSASDKIAIIDVQGLIGGSSQYVRKQIDRVRKDDHVKAVVLRVDSPGGTITGSDYIYHHLLELKKERDLPLVVSMGSMATSGGYYVAMAVGDDPQTIYAEPTTTTGSIGVIIPHYDVSGLLARYDVKDDSLASHPRKRMLSMTEPMTADDREVLEAYLQDAFNRFKDVVRFGRPIFRDDGERLNELATGEIFTAVRAKENGLVDELGFIEDAINRAADMAQLDDGSYRVVEFKSPMTILDALGAQQAHVEAGWEWRALLELSAPKAYYLSTSLPALSAWATSR